ncbi:sulfite exporter TauE/SafE family protein [Acinetobacter rudis]|uniref:Probable membrane transporter protein n=1 Tax=Acinetobacter rudis TaxID=632955 RepID=A0AAW8J8E7_9GAMM|nr:sulfite exporter TauE/SafE family protein [Acinetobacter rudis]MDQ8935460.1 sulfite exporter TauE/SafE family protein [Acinetobacter rudis]MDQ8953534.1 sulfite exporter TauE/SafE family protein [Acinetobacter rudis]MDQ9017773.1 sulfite exporter TauE/SafE family protein [Acinetobacter rudis]
MELLIYLAIGAVAGFSAGLFGIGGGLIIVPILYLVFLKMGYDPSILMHMALGTSLATIVVTSLSSVSAHHKKGAVLWNVFGHFLPGLLLGAFLGAGIAGRLSGEVLQLIIGVFVLYMAYKMFTGAKVQVDESRHLPSAPVQTLVGGLIGIASAIFGIGGGSLTVPYLNRCGVVMQKAIATSAACGLPIALSGAIGFMFFGEQASGEIKDAIGYVQIYAFLGISVMSFITAKLGAKVAHMLSPILLKKSFAIYLFFIGIYFIYHGIN